MMMMNFDNSIGWMTPDWMEFLGEIIITMRHVGHIYDRDEVYRDNKRELWALKSKI